MKPRTCRHRSAGRNSPDTGSNRVLAQPAHGAAADAALDGDRVPVSVGEGPVRLRPESGRQPAGHCLIAAPASPAGPWSRPKSAEADANCLTALRRPRRSRAGRRGGGNLRCWCRAAAVARVAGSLDLSRARVAMTATAASAGARGRTRLRNLRSAPPPAHCPSSRVNGSRSRGCRAPSLLSCSTSASVCGFGLRVPGPGTGGASTEAVDRPRSADAVWAELGADAGSDRSCGFRHGVIPGALAASAHHQQVAVPEFVAQCRAAAAGPEREGPRGAE
jgi:hypothetical protein